MGGTQKSLIAGQTVNSGFSNCMRLCELLGIEIPIIQAPMAGVQNWELAVAVSKAGALGSIPCAMLDQQQTLSEIAHFRSHVSTPFNLNFFCHEMPAPDEQKQQKYLKRLEAYYEQYELEVPTEPDQLRLPFNQMMADALAAVNPPVVSFHFGLPTAQLLKQVKSWGSVVISSATTVQEGRWLEDHGADIIVAQGVQAGGHRAMFLTSDISSQIPTELLVRQLVRELHAPIVAAGAIASSQDIDAMLDSGASGVQLGTTYLLCHEANTSRLHRDALKDSSSATSLTNIFSGRLARGINNKIMADLDYICDDAPDFPYAAMALNPLKAKAESNHLSDFSPLWAGTNRNACQEISATELTRTLWSDCKHSQSMQ